MLGARLWRFRQRVLSALRRLAAPHGLRRWWNTHLVAFSQRRQTERAWGKPIGALFELSSECFLKCPLCNTGGLRDRFPHVKRGMMSFETFRAGLDKLLPEVEFILLHSWGEPLLNPALFDCIRYAVSHRVQTQISSNLQICTEERAREIVDSGLDSLIVSCDGLTQETYEQYRAGGRLDKVVEAVDRILSFKRARASTTPEVEIQFIVFRHNEHEIDDFRAFWQAKGVDKISFIPLSYMSKYGREVVEECGMVPEHPDYQPSIPYGHLRACAFLYGNPTFDWDGTWYTCCFPSGMEEYRVGHILHDDFQSVWNGPKYRYYRRLLKSRECDGAFGETMCHDCVGRFPSPESKRYW